MALEANLISSGSILGVIDGKNWDRALSTHQSVLEALERLFYKTFLHKELSMDCNDQAMKENNYEVYKVIITQITDLFFSVD